MKILLVEDKFVMQELFKGLLEQNLTTKEFELSIIDNAKDAIQQINIHNNFELIVVDGYLIDSFGWDVLDHIKEHHEQLLDNVIFSSGKEGKNEEMAEKYKVKTLEKEVKVWSSFIRTLN